VTAITLAIGMVVLTAAALIWLCRCHHRPPLALLPPTTDARGNRRPARWYCDRCGKEWPAVFERPSAPIQKYSGFDPTKAPAAAKRAEELAARLKAAQVARAGTVEKRAAAPSAAIVQRHNFQSGKVGR
jgi:hypothetical protein